MITKDDALQLAGLVRENMAAIAAEWQAQQDGAMLRGAGAQAERTRTQCAGFLQAYAKALASDGFAARLMGTQCILSGIRPQIAQTIVHLGVEFDTVPTRATLADAFLLAIGRSGSAS